MTASSSPLQVELNISDGDRHLLGIVGTFLEQTTDTAADDIDKGETDETSHHLDRQAEYVKGIVGVKVIAPFNTSVERTGLPEVSFNDAYYTAIGRLTMSNFHVIGILSRRLLEISEMQQTAGAGRQAAINHFGMALDDPLHISVDDLRRLLLHPDRDLSFLLNLKSTPKGELFPQA
jgi:hypothetical protein